MPESIKHTAGAFVMQKLLQWLTPQEVVTLGKVSVTHVMDLANDTKGLHFMLKLVDCLVCCTIPKQLLAAVAMLDALHIKISEADAAKCAGRCWVHSQSRLRNCCFLLQRPVTLSATAAGFVPAL